MNPVRQGMVEKLRSWVEIKKFSAEFLSGYKPVDLLPPQVRENMLASEHGGFISRDLGEESMDEATFLDKMADLLEAEQSAPPEALERLGKIAEEKDRFAQQEQDELDEYEAFHEEDDEEPEADEDSIQEHKDDAEFFRKVALWLKPEVRPEPGTRWRISWPTEDPTETVWVIKDRPPNPAFFYVFEGGEEEMAEIQTDFWEQLLEDGWVEQLEQ